MQALKLVLGGLLLAMPYSAWALFGDSVRPYVSYSISQDSNYFRVANDAQAQALLGTSDSAVTSRTGEVGVDADLKFRSVRSCVLACDVKASVCDCKVRDCR